MCINIARERLFVDSDSLEEASVSRHGEESQVLKLSTARFLDSLEYEINSMFPHHLKPSLNGLNLASKRLLS